MQQHEVRAKKKRDFGREQTVMEEMEERKEAMRKIQGGESR